MNRPSAVWMAACAFAVACTPPDAKREEAKGPAPQPVVPPERDVAANPLVGSWRAVLGSPGGELPFELVFTREAGKTIGFIVNGEERVRLSGLSLHGDKVVLELEGYDSRIDATLSASEAGERLEGEWSKTIPGGRSKLSFVATKGAGQGRFIEPVEQPGHDVPSSVEGAWALTFSEEDGSRFVGRAELRAGAGDGEVLGTILTDTGDYRFLAGRYVHGTLALSCFDGGHAFLFRAEVDESGELVGSFWSRDRYHATWRGQKLEEGHDDALADPFSVVRVVDPQQRFRFAFPDLDGKELRYDDARFDGKVVIAEIFGTWCPNCNDYAPVLVDWDRKYQAKGLEIVGLAFEMTGNVERDREFVGKFAKRHGIEFPLLLAGTSDKKEAGELLPSLDHIASFPTTVLIDREGKVAEVHSGFAGPATGRHHTELVDTMEEKIESLLARAPPP